jgi:dihydrofolate synthase/folylpolyglutamate synthase
MGGRLDATNVIENPLITVITSIGMDHMAFLGNDLASIAREKGGIIKKGRPVVIDGSCREAVDVLAAICQERDCCFKITEKNALKRLQSSLNEGQFFDYRQHRNLHTIMPGTYQLDNAAVALETVDILRKIPRDRFSRQVEGLLTERLTENVIAKGIAKARWSGRFEVVCSQPLVIVDGAHNPDGIRVLLNSVRNYLEGRQLIVMMGVFADKDYKTMLKLISEISDTLIAFRPDHVRGLDAARLAAEAATWFDDVEVAKNQQEAVEKAFALCGREDVILSLGSLSTIAGLKKELEKLL